MTASAIDQRALDKLQGELAGVYEMGPIRQPERFSGRVALLNVCRSELAKPGMSFAVHGARGLGKSSFVNVLLAGKKFLRRTSQADMDFAQLFWPIVKALDEGLEITEVGVTDSTKIKAGVKSPVAESGTELSSEFATRWAAMMPDALDLDFVATALTKHADAIDAVVVEEFQRLPASSQRHVVQLMHTLADKASSVHVVVIGITPLGEQVMTDEEFKDYVGRCITAIELPRMTAAELRDIIEKRVRDGVQISPEVADDLAWAASGYPAVIHRVMFSAAVAWMIEHLGELMTQLLSQLFASALGRLKLQSAQDWAVVRKVELSSAGLVVARPELEAALHKEVSTFESQNPLVARGYAAVGTDGDDRGLAMQFAESDEDDHAQDVATALGLAGEVSLPPGFRAYVRARLLLDRSTP
jgi:hypothetical protein